MSKWYFLIVLLSGMVWADRPLDRFAISVTLNGKLFANTVPAVGSYETYQDVANEFFAESFYMFKAGDEVVMEVYYPKYEYDTFTLYGCILMNNEGGTIGSGPAGGGENLTSIKVYCCA